MRGLIDWKSPRAAQDLTFCGWVLTFIFFLRKLLRFSLCLLPNMAFLKSLFSPLAGSQVLRLNEDSNPWLFPTLPLPEADQRRDGADRPVCQGRAGRALLPLIEYTLLNIALCQTPGTGG